MDRQEQADMLENRTLATRVDSPDENGILMPAAAAAMAGRAPERSAPSILTIIWRRRWVFFGCILIALACAAGYLYKAVSIYSSSSQIVVQQSAPKMISDVLNSGQAAANYLFTQCDIIRSTAIITTAL